MTLPLPILTFHHIHPERDVLTIPPRLFERALVETKRRHTFIDYTTFTEWLLHDKPLPPNPLLLTLDDGYLDNFIYAFPVLEKLKIPGVLFAVTGMVEEATTVRKEMPPFLDHKRLEAAPDPAYFINTAEIEAMEASGLITVESHTVSHFACKGADAGRIEDELLESLAFIQSHSYPRKHYGFCWPRGRFDKRALEIIRKTPYDFAFSTVEGTCRRDGDRYTLRRIDCSSYDGDETRYLRRLRRKLFIYGAPGLSHLYERFREWRIRKRRQWKNR
jgi:peptidoglycan/xylan/chitin deacetylase (PgdA/CDA1 family)